MTRNEIKEKMRKIKWATERQTGKKLGKKGLLEVQGIVMQMQSAEQPKLVPKPDLNWKEVPKTVPGRITVNLTNLIGKNFAPQHREG